MKLSLGAVLALTLYGPNAWYSLSAGASADARTGWWKGGGGESLMVDHVERRS